MKTIEVSDEMYDQLMALSTEINQQDNRATAMPYFFQIHQEEKIFGVDGDYDNDGYIWYHPGSESKISPNRDEMMEWLSSYQDISVDPDITDEDLEKELEEYGCHKGYYRDQEVLHNAFFTSKACKEHIQANKHHYQTDAVDYLNHAFRNPELELVLKFLCELTGGSLHK